VSQERPVVEMPDMPVWTKMDNLGGLLPSEVRTSIREYAQAYARAILSVEEQKPQPESKPTAYLMTVDGRKLLAFPEDEPLFEEGVKRTALYAIKDRS
jgi:hypothetical protein